MADALVAVLAAAQRIHAVVKVDGAQAVEADYPVEVFQHAVEVVDQIIAGVVQVAGVEADAHFLLQHHAVENAADFLEGASDLAAFSGHRLEQHGGLQVRPQHGIQLLDDQRDAGVFALPGVAAGVKIVEVAGHVFHAGQIVPHHFECETSRLRIGGTRVEGVRRMCQQLAETVFGGQREKGVDVGQVQILGFPAARIAGEELEGVGTDRQRVAAHAEEALGRGQVAADVEHQATPALCACTSAQ